MKIVLSREVLLRMLQRCQSIVDKRGTKPILANVLLKILDSHLHITATDLEVTIQSHSPVEVLKAGELTVSAKKLFDIVKELTPDHAVELESKKSFLLIKNGLSRFKLATIPADDYPSIHHLTHTNSLQLESSQLADMITATAFAMSNDETRKYLTGALVDITENQQFRIVTTDGHRMALAEASVEEVADTARAIIPRKGMMEIRKLCDEHDGTVELSFDGRQVYLVAGSNILTSKLIDAQFPVYQDVIPTNNPVMAVVSRTEFDHVLRRIMIVANDLSHDICLKFSGSGLDISAGNNDQEEAEEHITAEYKGEDLAVGFNGRYLRDTLGVIRSQNIHIALKDELSPVLIYGQDDHESRYVVMPMRI